MKKITTNIQKTIEQLTTSSYYYVNSNINSVNFPIPEAIETEGYTILHFDKPFTSEEAIERMKKKGLRGANIYELALLKENHPELWPKGQWSALLAFGSIWKDADGYPRVPLVSAGSDGDFKFRLGRFAGGWPSGYALVCYATSPDVPQTLNVREHLDSLVLSDESKVAIAILKTQGFRITRTETKEIEY